LTYQWICFHLNHQLADQVSFSNLSNLLHLGPKGLSSNTPNKLSIHAG
jgi:hypothetical protein